MALPVMRVASLTPGATEIVCSLAMRSRLVGVSHECDHPASVSRLPVVTAPLNAGDAAGVSIKAAGRGADGAPLRYALRMDVLERVRPSLIVTQTLGEDAAGEALATALRGLPSKPRVMSLAVSCLEDVLETIARVGTAAGKPYQARRVVTRLKRRIAATRKHTEAAPSAERPRVAVLEWLRPPCNAGGWMPEIVALAGGVDCLDKPFAPSRRIDWQAVAASQPDVVLVALAGLDMAGHRQALALLQRCPGWQGLAAVQAGRVHVVDGTALFSRPGPRLVDGLEWLAHKLHPNVCPPAPGPATLG